MRVKMDINFSPFVSKCMATMNKVGTASYEATETACEDIMEESLKQVPRDTNTLANSAFYDVRKAGSKYEADLGYGGTAVNPKSGTRVMDYAVAVHEDLGAAHPVGKAKFLEDPIRMYAESNFEKNIIEHVKPLLDGDNNE